MSNGKDAVIGTYMSDYDNALGSVENGDDVSSLLTGFQTALSALAASPTSASDKAAAVSRRRQPGPGYQRPVAKHPVDAGFDRQ